MVIEAVLYICIYISNIPTEYYSAMRKKEILPFTTTWMDF